MIRSEEHLQLRFYERLPLARYAPTVLRAQDDLYRVTDLNTLPGFGLSYATGINSNGQVVGCCIESLYNQSHRKGFIWSASDGTKDLGILFDKAAGINNSGQVVGVTEGFSSFQHASDLHHHERRQRGGCKPAADRARYAAAA